MGEPAIQGFSVLGGSRIILPVEISSIDGNLTLGAIATIGTIQFANISVGTVEVGTITAQVDLGTVGVTGTLGTILSGAVTATISGGLLADIGTVGVLGTIGTILSPAAIVGTVQAQPASYVFTSVSATIRAAAGVLYQVNAAGESGLVSGPGTLLVLDSTSTITVIPVAAGGFVSAPFGPGVSFGTLIASIIGSIDATFVVK